MATPTVKPTMKAVRVHNYGSSEVLSYEEIERPTPGEGEILVKNYATTVNPVDWALREGYLEGFFSYTLPFTLGWDVAGTVEALGPGTSGFEQGQAVYGMVLIRGGTYAEYVLVRPEEIAPKPASLDWNAAAALPLVGLTAWQALFDAARLQKGQRILIHAAAGGVGSMAVQLAHNAGAYVIGTVSAAKHDFVRSQGADEVIDYRATPFEEAVKEVDVVFDTVGGETRERSWGVLKAGGVLVSVTAPGPSAETAAAHGVRTEWTRVQPNSAQLAQLTELVEAGKIKPVVDQVLTLAQAGEALDLNQGGQVQGKLVLKIA